MRLWHDRLIQLLPRQQLLGQHRECCALRGNGWGRKHATVDYVFRYSPAFLVAYHFLVMKEMDARGYRHAKAWDEPSYRGAKCPPWEELLVDGVSRYREHDRKYLEECCENLRKKGIEIDLGEDENP